MDEESRIKELLEAISNNEKYNGCVFHGGGVYFIIRNGEIWEMSDDASCSPKGGWFPEIVHGPTEVETECMDRMMEELGFDEEFFKGLIEDYLEFDDEFALEYFEENDDEQSAEIYSKIKERIESGETPFETIDDFVKALGMYGLDDGGLYYQWEDAYIDLYDNVVDTGDVRGSYDYINDDEWIKILENIDAYIVG